MEGSKCKKEVRVEGVVEEEGVVAVEGVLEGAMEGGEGGSGGVWWRDHIYNIRCGFFKV